MYFQCNDYQLPPMIIAIIIDTGQYNVSLKQIFKTLTIISLVQPKFLPTRDKNTAFGAA